MAEATSTPTPFSWPSGPGSVQVTGSWDSWVEKISLDKQMDGSFRKLIDLPSNTKVHYKFIVDGNWTTSQSEPTADDQGNVNNVVDVGPAPTPIESATIKATEIGAGVAAGVVGAAAAATAAVYSFTDQVNGNTTTTDGPTTGEKKDLTETEKKADPAATLRQTADESTGSEGEKNTLTQTAKKADPAAALRETADEDIRNSVPTSITSATHGAMPVIASAVATVTGADIFRGNAEALPVTQKEINDTQAKANKGDNAFLASRIEPQGGAISDPAAATTENAKAASSVANSATVGAPVVPVTNNGFAANITAQSGGLTTAADKGTEGGAKAAAVAAGSAGAIGAGGIMAASAAEKGNTTVKPDVAGGAVGAGAISESKEGTKVKPALTAGLAGAVGAGGAGAGSGEAADVVKKEETAVKPAVPGGMEKDASAVRKDEASGPAAAAGAAGVVGAAAAGGVAVASASKNKEEKVMKSSDIQGSATKSDAPKNLLTTGPASSKKEADKANAPAAASSGPLASGKETTTPASLPAAPSKMAAKPVAAPVTAVKETTKPAAAPAIASKTVPATPPKKPVSGSVSKSESKSHSRGVSAASKSTHTTMASEASSAPSTPDKKKMGLLGKIKQALSPNSSPNSK